MLSNDVMLLAGVWYRIFTFFLAAVFMLLPARPGAVALTVTREEDVIKVEYVNRTNREIEVGGNRFSLEKETDGQWEAIPFREGFGFAEISHSVPPTGGDWFTIRPERAFDEPLSPGRYRLTFYYYCAGMVGEASSAAEFDLT